MVVVGRLALFFSQLPTADSPFGFMVRCILRWFFPFVFFFPIGHEFLVFSVIFGVSI